MKRQLALTLALLTFVTPLLGLGQSTPTAEDEKMTVEKILALWKKADDRTKMIPELKSLMPDTKELKIEITFQDEGGKRKLPEKAAVEKWVDGTWMLTRVAADDFRGEDKEMIFATTYDSESKTYIQYLKPVAFTRAEAYVRKSTGKRVGEGRKIKWTSDELAESGAEEPLPITITTTTYTDEKVTWTEVISKGDVEMYRVMGTATKVR